MYSDASKNKKHNSPEIKENAISDARVARLIHSSKTEMIGDVMNAFKEADMQLPEANRPLPGMRVLEADDVRTYFDGRITRDRSRDAAVRALFKARRYNRSPDKQIIKRAHDPIPDYAPDDPIEEGYRHMRAYNQSGLGTSIKEWKSLNYDFDEIHRSQKHDVTPEESLRSDSATYGHDVHVVGFNDEIDNNRLPVNGTFLLVVPTFEQKVEGEQLAEAATAAILRIDDLSKDPNVINELNTVDFANNAIARSKETVRADDKEESGRHTGTRMLIEAVATTVQATALLLGGVKQEFNIREAIESLNKNGVYKLLSIMPPGIIGPQAVNGTHWNPEYVLDKQRLSEGEFALSDAFREAIVKSHIEARKREVGRPAVQNAVHLMTHAANSEPFDRIKKEYDGGDTQRAGLGCPADVRQMNYIVDLITRYIE